MDFNLARTRWAKALSPHPAFMDQTTPVTIGGPGRSDVKGLTSQRGAKRHMTAYGGDQAIDWLYDCIGLYADPVAGTPYRLEKTDGTKLTRTKTKGTPPDVEVGPADLYALLDKPNPLMLYSELLNLLTVDLLLVGNGYWIKWGMDSSGKPEFIYRASPAYVKIKPGDRGIQHYEYQPPGQRDPLIIQPEAMIHFRRPNPHDSFYGMGMLQGGGRSYDLELALTDTVASYYENKADPSLIVQSERRVPRDVFNKLRYQLRNRVSGPKRAGEMLVLEMGLKASSLSTSASDALFEQLSKMSRDRIYSHFRANPMLFGIMDEAGTGSKVADARREFDTATLLPFMNRLSEVVSDALTKSWGIKFSMDYRSVLAPDDTVKVNAEIAKVPGIKIRELRRLYSQFGIEESTGDPVIDETILNLPMTDLGPDGQPIDGSKFGGADQPLGTEPGRPPKGTNTTAINRETVTAPGAQTTSGKALGWQRAAGDGLGAEGLTGTPLLGFKLPDFADLDDRDAVEKVNSAIEDLERAVTSKALSGGDNVRTSTGRRLPTEQVPRDVYARFRKADIDRVMQQTTNELRSAASVLEVQLVRALDGKALKTSDIVARVKRSPAWKDFKSNVEDILLKASAESARSAAMHIGVTPEGEVDYDTIAKTIVYRPDGLNKIVKTIQDRMVKKIAEARDGNAERSDYEAAIRAEMAAWNESQAVLIADSEATEAYNEGTLSVAEMSGVDLFFVTDGDEDDEPCIEADGQVWTLDEARASRKEHPRCRRAFIPLPAGEEA